MIYGQEILVRDPTLSPLHKLMLPHAATMCLSRCQIPVSSSSGATFTDKLRSSSFTNAPGVVTHFVYWYCKRGQVGHWTFKYTIVRLVSTSWSSPAARKQHVPPSFKFQIRGATGVLLVFDYQPDLAFLFVSQMWTQLSRHFSNHLDGALLQATSVCPGDLAESAELVARIHPFVHTGHPHPSCTTRSPHSDPQIAH